MNVQLILRWRNNIFKEQKKAEDFVDVFKIWYLVPGGHGPAHCTLHWQWVMLDNNPWGVKSALPEMHRYPAAQTPWILPALWKHV